MIKVYTDKITQGNCMNCPRTFNLITIQFDSGRTQVCPECARQLFTGLAPFVEPEKPHSGEWFTLWEQDKKNILSAMHRNLAADLDAGYNYMGQSIQKQLADIDEYKHEFDEQLMSFVGKSNKEIEDWCYWDLKRRGAIE